MATADQTNAEVSDERLRGLGLKALEAEAWQIVHNELPKWWNDYARHHPNSAVPEGRLRELAAHAAVMIALTRRSVTSQASEGAVAWPEWATDKHIAEGILAEAETIVQLIIHGHEEQIAEHTGAIKSYAGTLLSRENHRHKYASPSKRVERLETANRALAEIKESFRIAGLGTIGAHWQSLIDAIDQALQGDRS